MENFDAVKYLSEPKWSKSRPGLERILRLLYELGNPQKHLKFVHVGGTNGKGSCCAYISQILINSGLKVGQFTSPFIWDFKERIQINNKKINDNDLNEITLKVRGAAQNIWCSSDNDVCDSECHWRSPKKYQCTSEKSRESSEKVTGTPEDIRESSEKVTGASEDIRESSEKVTGASENIVKEDHPTEFELITAVAMEYFRNEKCDIVVLEVGMGGSLDSTNVVQKEQVLCSVITKIGIDHVNFLGNSLQSIACEKSGIIKTGVPVVTCKQDLAAMDIIKKRAKKMNAELVVVYPKNITLQKVDLSARDLVRKFGYKNFGLFKTRMIAKYQPYNASIAIEVAQILKDKGIPIKYKNISEGIIQTRWPVRFDVVSRSPWVIVDGAHNPQGIKALIDSFTDVFGCVKPIFIFGMLADKDYKNAVSLIGSYAKEVFTVTPNCSRALKASDLAFEFTKIGINAIACKSLKSAAYNAMNLAQKKDVIICFGSLYSAGELYNLFCEHFI